MKLRVRIIVAFFLFSIVPLGAVTLYSYTSNAKALREAAGHEAELLADELGQRMQIVMAQLSERVEHLMDMSSEPASSTPAVARNTPATTRTTTNASAATAAPAPAATAPTQAATAAAWLTGDKLNETLGEVAMLLNNIEVTGVRGFGPPGGRGGDGGRGGGGRFRNDPSRGAPRGSAGAPPGSAPATAGAPSTPPPTPGPTPSAPVAPVAPTPPAAGAAPGATPGPAAVPPPPGERPPFTGRRDPTRGNPPGGDPARGDFSRGGGFPRGDFARGGQPGGPPPPPGAPAPPDPDAPGHIKIDLMPIRLELMRQFATEEEWAKLTPEQRQKIISEVNQRMLGVMQGIRMGAAEAQKRVAEVQKEVASAQVQVKEANANVTKGSAATAAEKSKTTIAAPPAASTSKSTSTSAPKPAASASASTSAAASPRVAAATVAPVRRKTELSGSRLDVTVERDGQVLHQANAEVNLPALLATVFTTTHRDRGEVPFAVAKDGQIYTSSPEDRTKIQALGGDAAKPESKPGTTVLPNWIVVTTADPTGGGLKFGIARPVGDSLDALRRTTARNAGIGFALLGLALAGIVPLSGRLTRNLSTLNEGVRRIAEGDYRARVTVKSHDEIGELAKAFNQMAEDVERHQHAAVEQERIKRELELGRQIQHDMLPHSPLMFGLTEISGVSVPAREVGGDFFNYFQLANGEVALLVGDVSGKGVGAALLMANIQASVRTRLAMGQDLAALAGELDGDIEASTPGPVYATLFVGILNQATRELRYVNAGHNPQYVVRRGGRLERMSSSGLPVGLLSGRGYQQQTVQLAAGDLLFFYTDGCVEAENEAGEMFSAERLEKSLVEAAATSSDVLVQVESVVTAFRGRREPFDDATMMAVRVG